jgi:hypothetical protein
MATDDYSRGVRKVALSTALKKRHIQANPPSLICQLVLDVDHDDAVLRAFATGLPEPSWVAQTQDGDHAGRAHVGYMLAYPVHKFDPDQGKARVLLGRVGQGLLLSIGADPSYTGVLTKNPIHPGWETKWGTPVLHTVSGMARQLGGDLPAPGTRHVRRLDWLEEAAGKGRNCRIFWESGAREWAYTAWVRYKDGPFSAFRRAVEDLVLMENMILPVPLSEAEARGIGKSIAAWTWEKFSTKGFVEVQRRRGVKSGKVRTARALEREAAVMRLRGEGVRWQVIADTLGMSLEAAQQIQTRHRRRQ